MLFQISWSVSSANRVACWNAFGKMTPTDDLKDVGDDIKMHGRWHHLSGSAGTCIAECDDAAKLNSWMLNWSPICDSVIPVVEDATAREVSVPNHTTQEMQKYLWMELKNRERVRVKANLLNEMRPLT